MTRPRRKPGPRRYVAAPAAAPPLPEGVPHWANRTVSASIAPGRSPLVPHGPRTDSLNSRSLRSRVGFDSREVTPVPTGKVKWYDADKGFGFLTRDDGGEVFVHSSALPAGSVLRAGQRVEFGVAEGRRGVQALQVRTLEPPPTVAKTSRKSPDEMIVIVEDLIKLLDGLSESYRRGRQPDARDAKKIAAVLRAVADDVEA